MDTHNKPQTKHKATIITIILMESNTFNVLARKYPFTNDIPTAIIIIIMITFTIVSNC